MTPFPRRLCLAPLLAALLGPAAVHAASFDCGKKLNQVETVICEDGELSQQDELLAAAYSTAHSAAFRQGGVAQRDALRREERAWVERRGTACALSDIDNEASRAVVKRCIAATTGLRIDALKAAAAAVAATDRQAGDEYRRGADDLLQLVEQPDGRASVAIMAGNARGVCDVELDGRRLAPGRYLFTDTESGCSVSVDVAGNSATVDSSGACSSLCGAHAPGFTGAYLRKPGPRAVNRP
jgi:uncharacterized protein YecT (DUF1311 family)